MRERLRRLVAPPVSVLRAHPVAAALILAVVVVALPGSVSGAAFIVAIGVSYACGSSAATWPGLAAVCVVLGALQVAMGFSEFPNVELALGTLAPWWIGREVRRRGELVDALAARTRELEAEEDAFVRLSVRRERARIAHELHDIVAHHLAVIVIQAGAGRMAPAGVAGADDERFAAIRVAGRNALADMARLVDVLHADDDDGRPSRLRELLEEVDASGLDVSLSDLPAGVKLADDVDEAAYRVVREGLTNAIKHAPGAVVHVHFTVRGDELDVEVSDSGAADPSSLAATGSGIGLEGMRRRVEALGGRLDAGPRPEGGWRLHAVLPLAEPAVIPAG
jgi:signal transduction histidine kinase